jgi:hypothetical protein
MAALIALSLFGLAPGCKRTKDDGLTYGQARAALDEAQLATEAATLVDGTIEISTSFTIGQAVEAAAQQIRDFITSQLPCAGITLSGATLSIEYGKNPGNCTFKGNTYTGKQSIAVARNDQGDVVVDHTWTEVSNGKLSVSGTAKVTWSLSAKSRHVEHTLNWTRLSDGRTLTGKGDRTQTVLEGGLAEGLRIDGTREWTGVSGTWDLAIDRVELRWIDPVPQSGSYVLRTPDDKSLTLSFERVNETKIRVTVESGDKRFQIDVSTLG